MQELYVTLVKDKLKRYLYAKDFIINANREIKELRTKIEGKVIVTYGEEALSGGVKNNDNLINILAKIDLLETNIKENKKIIDELEYSFKGLSDEIRDITLNVYGRSYKSGKVKELEDKYHYSSSHLYRLANSGMKHIALRLFGDY